MSAAPLHLVGSASARSALTPLARIRRQAERRPDAIALIELGGRRHTRAEFAALVDAVQRGLAAEGFAAGDRVLFSVRPGAAALALVLAVHELGGVLVPLDPGTGDSLFAARIAQVAPRWVLAEGILLARPDGWVARMLRILGMRLAPLGAVPDARYVSVGMVPPGAPHSVRFADLVRRGSGPAVATGPHHQPPPCDDAAESFIVHTSGTTSAPQAVVHTRGSLGAILDAVERELGAGEGDVVYSRELHMLLPALAMGARVVVPRATAFGAKATLHAFVEHQVTHAFLVTRDCRLLLEECTARGDAVSVSLRLLLVGAAPVRSEFLARLGGILPFGCTVWCIYGATEMLPIARVTLAEKVAWEGEGDLVGRLVAGASARVREDGQLCVRGDRLCAGYLGEAPMHEFATGDLARIDQGRVVLLGRAKDMIIRGEQNIYPSLHEPVVERIAGVRRAAMVGLFDRAAADERVVLVIEPAAGVDAVELRARVMREIRSGRSRLDRGALPDDVVVRALPESGRSHKVDKGALRRALGETPDADVNGRA